MKIHTHANQYDLISAEKKQKKNKATVLPAQFKKFSFRVSHGTFNNVRSRPLKRLQPLRKLIKKSNKSNRSVHDIYNYQRNLVQAATLAMKEMGQNTRVLNALSNQLEAAKFKHDRSAKKTEFQMVRQLRSHLVGMLIKQLIQQGHTYLDARKLAVQTFRKSFIAHLNGKHWQPINTLITYQNTHYQSEQLPASKMKLGMDDIFAVSYNNKGISSSSATEVNHANNLWNSTLTVMENGQKKVLFNGIRHGVLSPYLLPENSSERIQGAKNKAQEVITAALFSQPDRLKDALNGNTVKLRLVSTSLLTNTSYIVDEATMLREQTHAWNALSQGPITLSIRNADGQIQEVKVEVDVCAFNFGVNELALKLKMGNMASDEFNQSGLHHLFGADLRPEGVLGGWVGDYLATQPQNAEKVIQLSRQIKTILQNKLHHTDGQEPYKAAERLAILGFEIGAVPCWNCKSGKDRTGMLDTEIKREVISYQKNKQYSEPGNPFDGNDKTLLKEVIANSGNSEIQYYNTGLKGNKVMKTLPFSFINLSYKKRIADDAVANTLKGLSELATI